MHIQVERAIELGLEQICFTEHLDLDPAEYDLRLARPGDERDGFLDEQKYDQIFNDCQRIYGQKITLLQGVEAGELARFAELGHRIITAHDYDFVLGSVHSLYDMQLSVPWLEKPSNAKQVYNDFFLKELALAQNPDFDVLAHLDIVKRHSITLYGPFDPTPYEEIIREIFSRIISTGKGIEINTSGLRQLPQETMPSFQMIKWYKEMGGEILTLGSDAHSPENIAYRFDYANDLAQAAGFKYLTTFVKRKPSFYRIY